MHALRTCGAAADAAAAQVAELRAQQADALAAQLEAKLAAQAESAERAAAAAAAAKKAAAAAHAAELEEVSKDLRLAQPRAVKSFPCRPVYFIRDFPYKTNGAA